MYEKIPQELKEQKAWVCVYRDYKYPMQATNPMAASSSNPETWGTFEEAVTAVEQARYDGIGYVFHGTDLIGIDLDAGFDQDGFLSDMAIDILAHCGSYCEKSRSGRGVHILVKGCLPFSGRNNRAGVEMYQTGRYFICTGKQMLYENIVENQEAVDYIVKTYFSEFRESESAMNPRIYSPVYQKPEDGKFPLRPKYPPIAPGCRNISLTSLAGQLHTQGYDKQDIYRELLIANKEACKPPLPEDEIKQIVKSVSRYRR